MAKGGYQIVDLKNKSLTVDTEATIDGVYKAVKKCNGKPTLVTGLNIGGTAVNGFYTLFKLSSTSYVATCTDMGYTITIANDDGVTVASIES